MPRKINFRISDEDSALLDVIKQEICAESDAPAIRYAIKNAVNVLRGRSFAPPLPDSVRNFTRPIKSPELPVIEQGDSLPSVESNEPDINYIVDEHSSAFRPPRK